MAAAKLQRRRRHINQTSGRPSPALPRPPPLPAQAEVEAEINAAAAAAVDPVDDAAAPSPAEEEGGAMEEEPRPADDAAAEAATVDWPRALAKLLEVDQQLRAAQDRLDSDAAQMESARSSGAAVEAALGRIRSVEARRAGLARELLRAALSDAEALLRDGSRLRGLAQQVALAEEEDERVAAWIQVNPRGGGTSLQSPSPAPTSCAAIALGVLLAWAQLCLDVQPNFFRFILSTLLGFWPYSDSMPYCARHYR